MSNSDTDHLCLQSTEGGYSIFDRSYWLYTHTRVCGTGSDVILLFIVAYTLQATCTVIPPNREHDCGTPIHSTKATITFTVLNSSGLPSNQQVNVLFFQGSVEYGWPIFSREGCYFKCVFYVFLLL